MRRVMACQLRHAWVTAASVLLNSRWHAYEQGNLCWQAAAEAEQATDAMALRIWPEEVLSPDLAQRRLQDAIHGAVAPCLMDLFAAGAGSGLFRRVSTQHLASCGSRERTTGRSPARAFKDWIFHRTCWPWPVHETRMGSLMVVACRSGGHRPARGLPGSDQPAIRLPRTATGGHPCGPGQGRTSIASWWCAGDGGSGPCIVGVLQRLPAAVATLLKSTGPTSSSISTWIWKRH